MTRIPLLTCVALAAVVSHPGVVMAEDTKSLQVFTVQVAGQSPLQTSLSGVVEAVRQTSISTQVAGAVVALKVKAGDRVRAGQELLRMDARTAQQGVLGARAQVDAAQANLAVATQELARQKQLLQKQYISQAAFERAQAQWDAAQSQVKALQAQTRVAQAQSGFFVVTAPYAGVVSEVQVTLGDMAMPGRALLTVYDSAALRVTASVPQALLGSVVSQQKSVQYELPGVAGASARQTPLAVQLLPAVDPVTHSGELRLALPSGLAGVVPGVFARVWVAGAPTTQGAAERIHVPSSAIVRRSELTGVYVMNPEGQPRLRQVRLGQISGDQVEVLSGLRAGEAIATDPQAAAAVR